MIALIVGVSGQDGSYLAEFLLDMKYTVHGMVRRSSESLERSRLIRLQKRAGFVLHMGDLADAATLHDIITRIRPTEIYNLAAQSNVRASFDMPEYTSDVNGLWFVRLIQVVRAVGISTSCKIFQASSSEMFGEYGGKCNEDICF